MSLDLPTSHLGLCRNVSEIGFTHSFHRRNIVQLWPSYRSYLFFRCANTAVGFNAQGKKTLAHSDYHLIQSMWHPTKNEGKVPADFTHGSGQKIWLQCPGCIHKCGRIHEWKAEVSDLSRSESISLCAKCLSRSGVCPCRSVANHPILSKEWHPDNPPAIDVSFNSSVKYLWICRAGHLPFKARCSDRCCTNTGCPLSVVLRNPGPRAILPYLKGRTW
jgi:hypothetical protein